ncbi:MAG TPA: metalloregulator ArsR/SmtB family transcription factor [Candidatus Acidoferrum sp.]|nr:metalloregulator ArsR/SmtB family transcription factor [Candidatus Acidoferrum sp.]
MQALNSRNSEPRRSFARASSPKRQNAVFRALADPTRREVLALLRQQPLTVNEIAVNFRMSRPAVSKHLRILERAGLVVTRAEGTARRCGLNARPLRAINDWLRDYEIFWSESLQSLKKFMEGQ